MVKSCAATLLLLLVLSQLAMLPTEARHLRHCKKCSPKRVLHHHPSSSGRHVSGGASVTLKVGEAGSGRAGGVKLAASPAAGQLDEYRPTAPGRSPGVGH